MRGNGQPGIRGAPADLANMIHIKTNSKASVVFDNDLTQMGSIDANVNRLDIQNAIVGLGAAIHNNTLLVLVEYKNAQSNENSKKKVTQYVPFFMDSASLEKWVARLIEAQQPDGTWGRHSVSIAYDSETVETEPQATHTLVLAILALRSYLDRQ